MIKQSIILILSLPLLFFPVISEAAEKPILDRTDNILMISDFIQEATKNDTVFEAILIDELALKYQKQLQLPAKDILLSIKGEYNFILNQNREEPIGSISLSKLFPYTGTETSAAYQVSQNSTSQMQLSDFNISIAQPIAKNAFGKATRLLDKIIGLEIEITKHQIIEAYEDYLSTLIMAYYDWYEAYEKMLIGESSYNENVKLLDNIKERQKNKIALDIDVNKTYLQLLTKEKTLINLKETYLRTSNTIKMSIRHKDDKKLIPQKPDLYESRIINYENDVNNLKQNSRTFIMLRFLEERSSLNVAKEANDLLPSINLILGYNREGNEYNFQRKNHMLFTGIHLDYPLTNQIDNAEYEISKIEEQKIKLTTNNVYYQLSLTMQNLALSWEKEKKLFTVTEEGIKLAKTVLEDETQNYTFGKVSLNDYIDAVNALDNLKFDNISHLVQIKKLKLEWLRLTDSLISRQEIKDIK